MAAKVRFAGVIDASTIDCSGKGVCAVIYLCGCPFRCPWCHNPELVINTDACKETDAENIVASLKGNFLITSVTITGGEPLMQDSLPELVAEIKKSTCLGIKIDTNGFYPERLEAILPFIDSVSMDIKAGLSEAYGKATGLEDRWPEAVKRVRESLDILKDWNGDKEARTTIVPGVVDSERDVEEIANAVSQAKFQRYVLQQFRSDKTLDLEYGKLNSPTLSLMHDLGITAKAALPGCKVFTVSSQMGMQEVSVE